MMRIKDDAFDIVDWLRRAFRLVESKHFLGGHKAVVNPLKKPGLRLELVREPRT